MARNEASAIMRADNRKLSGDLGKSRKMFKRAFRGIGRGIKGVLGKVFSPLALLAGGVGIGAGLRDVADFEEKLTRLQIQSGVSGDAINKFRLNVVSMSKETGISRKQLIGGVDALVNLTGAAGFSTRKLDTLAKAHLATGASMKDLAGLSFALEKSFDLKTTAQLQKGLSGIIQAGKDGAIPLGEMSILLQQLSASFSQVGGKGTGAAADLASALQVLRPGFGTASEAGTGLQGLLTALAKKSKILGRANIRIFKTDPETGIKTFRGFRAILDDFAKSKLIKDPAALTKALGRVEAKKALEQLIKNRAQFEELSVAARKSNAVIIDAEKFRNSSAGKLKRSMNNVKEAIAKAFTPERIEQFAELMGKASVFVGFIADNLLLTATVFATFKIGGFVIAMRAAAASSAATAASSAATATATSASALSAAKFAFAMKAAAVAGAAFAGFKIGTALDEAFGISDKISTLLNDLTGDATKSNISSTALNSNIQSLNKLTVASGLPKQLRDSFGISGRKLQGTADILRTARATRFQAREKGILRDGKVDPTGAGTLDPTKGGDLFKRGLAGIQTFGPAGADDPTVKGIQDAVRIANAADKLQAKGIKVVIVFDKSTGQLVARGAEDNESRRTPK